MYVVLLLLGLTPTLRHYEYLCAGYLVHFHDNVTIMLA